MREVVFFKGSGALKWGVRVLVAGTVTEIQFFESKRERKAWAA